MQAQSTYIHPAVACALILLCALIVTVRRRHLIGFVLAVGILIPMDQLIVVGPLHFPVLRILVLIAWVRVVIGSPHSQRILPGGVNAIDRAVVLCASLTALNYVLRLGTTASVVNQLGSLYTTCGLYFLFRLLIRNMDDLDYMLHAFAWVALAVATLLGVEQLAGRNPVLYLGGSGALWRAHMVEEGRHRAMGCFGHAILAGTFGATLLPLFFALWQRGRRHRRIAVVGFMSSSVIVIAANSSTPILAYGAGLAALCLWPIRKSMRVVRWGIVVVLITLHSIMNGPVWSLVARVDVTGSSSANHRYQLINQFILHFKDWWLLGTSSNDTWGWDMWDRANQYIDVGETGGLFPLICFLAILVFGFKYLGRALARAGEARRKGLYVWGFCGSLFANLVAFFGTSYFDQTIIVWYALLCAISVLYCESKPSPASLTAKAEYLGDRTVMNAG